MAFWGVEVKPSKPFVHSTEKSRGRLRISQATLGTGGSNEKSVVQFNVGKRSPVLLCVLLPNQTESCQLGIEFEEADDVRFSVIGPRSVHLAGYYVAKSCHCNPHSDTESYGVDIDNSPSQKSSYRSEDDKYEDSFIDDDDELQLRLPSPVSSSKEVDASTPENDNLKNRNGCGKRLRKKNQVVESDDESEDEDEDVRTISEPLENANQPEKKIKKEALEKTQVEGDLQLSLPSKMDEYENASMNVEDHTRNEETVPKRTLSNGLIIEELANGPADGKMAALGKKVKIYFTAMVKESGLVFDSNVGKTAFKFRLGDEGIIEGLNLGIDGMHVGDKRRLVVPPSLGFGEHEVVENVPGDSWLVYDVELAGVRR